MKYTIFLAIFCLGVPAILAGNIENQNVEDFDIGKTIYEEMHRRNGPSPRLGGIVDGLLDELFAVVRVIIRDLGFSSIPLPNIGPIPIGDSIQANLSNGFISGFQTLHRTGGSKLAIEPNGDIFILIDGGGNAFALLYDLSLNLFGIPVPLLSLSGHLDWINLKISLRVDAQFQIRIETLELENLGNVNLKVQGLGDIVSVIIQFIAQIIGNMLKNIIADFLATTIKDILNYILSNITRGSIATDGTLSIGSQGAKAVKNVPMFSKPTNYN